MIDNRIVTRARHIAAMYFDHIIDNMDAVTDDSPAENPAETRAGYIRLWRWIEPLLPKIGAVVFMLAAFSVPVLTHGDMLSSPAALMILISSAGLFFACTWNEFRDI